MHDTATVRAASEYISVNSKGFFDVKCCASLTI